MAPLRAGRLGIQTRADGPHRLVGDHECRDLLFGQPLEAASQLGAHDGIRLAGLILLQVLANRDDRAPPIGRYNPGQKLLFWVLLASMLILLVSGIAIWQPYFAPSVSIGILRFGALMHALSALALILLVIVLASQR